MFDLDAELKIWVRGEAQPIKKEFKKNYSVNEIYKIVSRNIL